MDVNLYSTTCFFRSVDTVAVRRYLQEWEIEQTVRYVFDLCFLETVLGRLVLTT
jgi:hypothetical protein